MNVLLGAPAAQVGLFFFGIKMIFVERYQYPLPERFYDADVFLQVAKTFLQRFYRAASWFLGGAAALSFSAWEVATSTLMAGCSPAFGI